MDGGRERKGSGQGRGDKIAGGERGWGWEERGKNHIFFSFFFLTDFTERHRKLTEGSRRMKPAA